MSDSALTRADRRVNQLERTVEDRAAQLTSMVDVFLVQEQRIESLEADASELAVALFALTGYLPAEAIAAYRKWLGLQTEPA